MTAARSTGHLAGSRDGAEPAAGAVDRRAGDHGPGGTGFVRFQSAVPNRHGRFPGVFALANGLGRSGLLEPADHAWWAAENARGDGLCPDPSRVDPTCYDRELNRGARAWFQQSATELIGITAEYLCLLSRYGVRWVELRTASPGRVVHADDVQVVAVPYDHAVDWPFPAREDKASGR